MWGAIFSLIGNVAGAWFESEGNKSAAKRTARTEAALRELDRLDAEADQERLRELEKQARPGMKYMQQVIASDPSMVSPEQQQVIGEGMRDTVRAISPGMRGSGRATTAIVRDVEQNTRNRFLTENEANRATAATRLQGMMLPLSSARTAISDRLGAGRRGSLRIASDSAGNRDTANAAIASGTVGSAIGSIGGMFDVDKPPGGTGSPADGGYDGSQGSPSDLGGALGVLSRTFAKDEGRERKYDKSSRGDVRID